VSPHRHFNKCLSIATRDNLTAFVPSLTSLIRFPLDEEFLENVTQCHKLMITEDKAVPIQVSKGRKTLDLTSTHEETDIVIMQLAINVAKEHPGSC